MQLITRVLLALCLSGVFTTLEAQNDSVPALPSLLGTLNAYPFEYGAWVGNVTVANTTAESYLTVHPTGFGRPASSNLNWKAGEIRPNLVMMGTDSYGFNTFFNAAGSTDVIVDIAGWYTR